VSQNFQFLEFDPQTWSLIVEILKSTSLAENASFDVLIDTKFHAILL